MELSVLSNESLVSEVVRLSRVEHETTLLLLLHLNELEGRRLFLELGYSSLFDYMVRKLRYSESAANRRIMTARCIRRFPLVYGHLERKELSLSTVSVISGVLTEENVEEILPRIIGKGRHEVDRVVASLRAPLKVVRESIVPVFVVREEGEKKVNDFSLRRSLSEKFLLESIASLD